MRIARGDEGRAEGFDERRVARGDRRHQRVRAVEEFAAIRLARERERAGEELGPHLPVAGPLRCVETGYCECERFGLADPPPLESRRQEPAERPRDTQAARDGDPRVLGEARREHLGRDASAPARLQPALVRRGTERVHGPVAEVVERVRHGQREVVHEAHSHPSEARARVDPQPAPAALGVRDERCGVLGPAIRNHRGDEFVCQPAGTGEDRDRPLRRHPAADREQRKQARVDAVAEPTAPAECRGVDRLERAPLAAAQARDRGALLRRAAERQAERGSGVRPRPPQLGKHGDGLVECG